jgi:hypothetical protein
LAWHRCLGEVPGRTDSAQPTPLIAVVLVFDGVAQEDLPATADHLADFGVDLVYVSQRLEIVQERNARESEGRRHQARIDEPRHVGHLHRLVDHRSGDGDDAHDLNFRSRGPASQVARRMKQQLEQAPELLCGHIESIWRETREVEVIGHIRSGSAADAILQVAADIGADLLVLGTHRRTGLQKLLLGSVTVRVLHSAVRCCRGAQSVRTMPAQAVPWP